MESWTFTQIKKITYSSVLHSHLGNYALVEDIDN